MARFTDQQIRDYEASLRAQGMTQAEINADLYAKAKEYDVDLDQIDRAFNLKSGSAKSYVTEDTGRTRDWAAELLSRGTDEYSSQAFELAKEKLNMSDAINIMQGFNPDTAQGNLAYTIDAFGRDRDLGWITVDDLLYGKTGDDFNYPYNDALLVDQFGGMFGDDAAAGMKYYADRYGMGSDDIASYLTAHTGNTVTPEQVQDYLFKNDMGQLYGTPSSYTPKPDVVTGMADYSAYDKKPSESLTDYYSRLSQGRSGGILGTRDITQGMLASPSIVNEVMETQIGNGQAGAYTGGDSNGTPYTGMSDAEAYKIFTQGFDPVVQAMYAMGGPVGAIAQQMTGMFAEDQAMKYLAEQYGMYGAGNTGEGSSGTPYTATTQPSGQYMDFDFGSNSSSTNTGYTGQRSSDVPPPK